MKIKILEKFNALVLSKKKFRNWYIFPLIYFKIYPRSIVKIYTKKGNIINLRTKSTDFFSFVNIWLFNEYGQNQIDFKSTDVIIDIGSHIGLFAIYISQFNKNGKILCYEPYDENYKILLENIENNNFKNIFTFNKAVSKKNGEIFLYINKDTAANNIYDKSSNFIKVNSTTLKEIIDSNHIEKCELLKLDCEGAEYEILMNLDPNIFKKINNIIMECHFVETEFIQFTNLKKFLIEMNYNVETRNIDSELAILYCKKIGDKIF